MILQKGTKVSIYLRVGAVKQFLSKLSIINLSMISLKKALSQAKKDKVAIAHFNISDSLMLKAIFESARELSAQTGKQIPVLVGLSEGERDAFGTSEAAAAVKFLRKTYDFPIFTNADHTHSLEKCVEAAKAGFDAILFDGGKLPLNENIAKTKEVVAAVKAIDKKILVEGEMGYIGSGSEVIKEIPAGAALKPEDITKPEDAERFVAETGVDMFAPAVGNIHGMLADASEPHLYIEAIKKIRRAAKVPLVLHGGSGTPEEDFIKAIDAGVRVLHISTEVRRAWRRGIEEGMKNQPNEVAPHKIEGPALAEMKKVITMRLKMFNRIS
jgi:fructose-bisphosphate aldolase, class II